MKTSNTDFLSILRAYNKRDPLDELKEFKLNLKPIKSIRRVCKINPEFSETVINRDYHIVRVGVNAKDTLQNQLRSKALKSGVDLKFEAKGNVNAEVIATGTPKTKINIFGQGYCFEGLNIEDDMVYLIYDDEIAPRGYVYIVSDGKEGTLVSVNFEKSKFPKTKELLDLAIRNNPFLKRVTKGAVVTGCISGGGYYSRDPYLELYDNKSICVGEAAGLQDATRGFGIRYAILSGCIGAQSIIDHEDYCLLLKKYFGDEFKNNYIERAKLQSR